MIGEFGGIGAFVPGKEWAPNQCSTYLRAKTPQEEADLYVQMAGNITLYRDSPGVSVSIYTQITDVEVRARVGGARRPLCGARLCASPRRRPANARLSFPLPPAAAE